MKMIWYKLLAGSTLALILGGCSAQPTYDLILRNGTIYDGNGSAPVTGDLEIQGNTLAELGPLPDARGKVELDVAGMAVAPGFVNMMCQSELAFIDDGRSLPEK